MEKITVKVTRLRALRAERGLSYKDIVEMSGVAKSTLLHYEAKTKRITRKNQIRLCKAFDINEDTDLEELVEIDRRWLHKNSHTFN